MAKGFGVTNPPEPIVPELVEVVLILSVNEAYALGTALAHVGGSDHTTARKHTDSILCALRDAGASWQDSPFRTYITGSACYKDIPNSWENQLMK